MSTLWAGLFKTMAIKTKLSRFILIIVFYDSGRSGWGI